MPRVRNGLDHVIFLVKSLAPCLVTFEMCRFAFYNYEPILFIRNPPFPFLVFPAKDRSRCMCSAWHKLEAEVINRSHFICSNLLNTLIWAWWCEQLNGDYRLIRNANMNFFRFYTNNFPSLPIGLSRFTMKSVLVDKNLGRLLVWC